MRLKFDMVVVGSGFAGSLMALIGARLGLKVALVERGRHPRFAMGESSTPLANLLLEQLSRRYDLERVLPLAKWGHWQKELPKVACGLKRGFSFVHHRAGQRTRVGQAWEEQLLVAASPRDAIADTHWYREDFDQHLLTEARQMGVMYLDGWETTSLSCGTEIASGEVRGTTTEGDYEIEFQVLFDATGGGRDGCVGKFAALRRSVPEGFLQTRALYTHFEGVARWGDLHPDSRDVPYPVDDSALHHVFADGWVWVLRFNNGVTSAGVIAREESETAGVLKNTETGWGQFLARNPAIGQQFEAARPLRPFMTASPVSFMVDRVVVGRCVLLPSAVGFVDPMFSTGFPLVLLGIERLALWLERNCQGLGSEKAVDWAALEQYGKVTNDELRAAARFMGAIYRVMGDFEAFHAVSLLYFTAAIYSETVRRLGKTGLPTGFLLWEHAEFHRAMDRCLALAGTGSAEELWSAVRSAVAPLDLGGLLQPRRPRCYWAEVGPMLDGAAIVGSNREEMAAMLERVEFW